LRSRRATAAVCVVVLVAAGVGRSTVYAVFEDAS